MYPLYVLTFVLALIAMWDPSTDDALAHAKGRGDAIAGQMSAYHSATVRTCLASTCAQGRISVPTANLPPQLSTMPVYSSGEFRSVSNGTGLIWTYYMPAVPAGADGLGEINRALADEARERVAAGPYDAATQQIRSRSIRDGSIAVVTVPNGIDGVAMPSGTPVIVTRVR